MANAPLQDLTPAQIDGILAPMWERQAIKKFQIAGKKKLIAERSELVKLVLAGQLDDPRVRAARITTPADGIRLHQKLVIAREDLDFFEGELAKLKMESRPYENEYDRRGGWNRVYVAQSHDGHAHKGQHCSTCHHGEEPTQFAWLIQYSGKTEEEIVADAGERACTTCYPSAPVNVLKQRTKMFTPDEVEAQRARDERAIKAAAKKAAAESKAITTPEGGKLYEDKRNDWVVKTLRTAEIAATDALVDLILAKRHATDPEWAFMYEGGRVTPETEQMQIARHAWCLIRSIAAKKGLTFQEVFETHEKKAQAKVRKMDREWAKDPRNPNRSK